MILEKPPRRSRKPRQRIRRSRTLGAKRRLAKAVGFVDPDGWQAVIEFYGYRCAMGCGRYWEERGHVQSIAHGGEDTLANLMPLCAPCNRNQSTRTVWPPRRHPWMPSEKGRE